jgi:hypothetical protein
MLKFMDSFIMKHNCNFKSIDWFACSKKCEKFLANVSGLEWRQLQAFEGTMLLDNNISISQVHHLCMLLKTWHTTQNFERENGGSSGSK